MVILYVHITCALKSIAFAFGCRTLTAQTSYIHHVDLLAELFDCHLAFELHRWCQQSILLCKFFIVQIDLLYAFKTVEFVLCCQCVHVCQDGISHGIALAYLIKCATLSFSASIALEELLTFFKLRDNHCNEIALQTVTMDIDLRYVG